MPYIKSDDYGCTPWFDRPAANVGELTFQVTCVVQQYLIPGIIPSAGVTQ